MKISFAIAAYQKKEQYPKHTEFVIERVRDEGLHSVVVALQIGDNETFPPLPQQLAAFPFGYRYCGMATYPNMQQRIQIWQSQAR